MKAGAPEGIISWVDVPTLEISNLLMKEVDTILATGGPGMVKAAYSSGKPAIGVGAGDTPAVIDESADILLAVSSVIHSKTFDNGMICASEQSVEFFARGCGLIIQPLRVLRQINVLKIAVDVGLVVGITAPIIPPRIRRSR